MYGNHPNRTPRRQFFDCLPSQGPLHPESLRQCGRSEKFRLGDFTEHLIISTCSSPSPFPCSTSAKFSPKEEKANQIEIFPKVLEVSVEGGKFPKPFSCCLPPPDLAGFEEGGGALSFFGSCMEHETTSSEAEKMMMTKVKMTTLKQMKDDQSIWITHHCRSRAGGESEAGRK
uniref:Uncharacterized protein n=1 Tax=Opuntia streptacantha TaxID=393608 RepID=A0A7C8ZU73_OPUST